MKKKELRKEIARLNEEIESLRCVAWMRKCEVEERDRLVEIITKERTVAENVLKSVVADRDALRKREDAVINYCADVVNLLETLLNDPSNEAARSKATRLVNKIAGLKAERKEFYNQIGWKSEVSV